MILTVEQAIERAPAIATTVPHPYKGEGFVHVNTEDVIRTMVEHGWGITDVMQAKGTITTRGVNTGLYNQHIVRMRSPDYMDAQVGDVVPEAIIRNSHDGSGCFMFMLGLWRFYCTNGLIIGETLEELRIQHRWLDAKAIVEMVEDMWRRQVPRVLEWRERALARNMSQEEQGVFAHRAQILRFPERSSMPFHPRELLVARRPEDEGDDLWRVYNRVQENIIKGGIEGQSEQGRLTRTRTITGVQATVDINRSLFDLADRYLRAA